MKSEQAIWDEIKEIEKAYDHVLKGSPATISINAPRALLQLEAVSRIKALYFVLDKKRPKYEFEKC